jgi:hypothetical protein
LTRRFARDGAGGIDELEQVVDPIAGKRDASLAVGRKDVFDGVGSFRDARLFDHPRRSLEGVCHPEQTDDELAASRVFLQLEHALHELLDQIARLDAEVSGRDSWSSFRHSLAVG